MNTDTCKFIAIVGGSGSGKSWLANRLLKEFGNDALTLSLDDFYCDLSHLTLSEREKINFDDPDTIDWALFESVLDDLKNGQTVVLPQYDFVTHNRKALGVIQGPRPLIIVEGLWLLWPEQLREKFDLKIFLDCPESLRWQRRLARDLETRGRTMDSVCDRFWRVVVPMHESFVEVQKAWVDLVIGQPTTPADFNDLTEAIRELQQPETPVASRRITPEIAVLHTL